jgi:hypothetical protein
VNKMKRTRAIERQPKASVDWKPTSTCPFSELRLQLINPSTSPNELNTTLTPHSIIHGDACFAYFNKIWGTPCRTGGLPMHTIILAFVIALAGLVVIAGGALELSTLEAAEGEMLQVSDYLSGIGTIASGLGMLGLAEALRLLLRITA